MDTQAFLEGYLHKTASSVSDSIVARYGTNKFRDSYKKARDAGRTTQQASKQAIKASPRVVTTPKAAPTSPKLQALHASSKRTYDQISSPEQKAQYANKLKSIYTDTNVASPAWIDPVKAMSKEDKLQAFKTLGQAHAKTLTDPTAKSEFVQRTLSNIDRQGLSDTPEWMYDAMRRGQLDASTEALLKHRYMQTPEYQANWQRGQDLFDQKLREFNAPSEAPVKKPSLKEIFKPKQQPQQKSPEGNLFAGNTSID